MLPLSRYDQLAITLTNHAPTAEQVERIEAVRESAKAFGATICELVEPSRFQSLALTALEEATMRAVQGIVLEGKL